MIENQLIIKLKDTIVMEITKNKITEFFCIIDDFCQEYDKETQVSDLEWVHKKVHKKRLWVFPYITENE